MEQHFVFIKDNRVMQVAVFALQDEALADAVAQERGFDDAVWVGTNAPAMWSTYDGKVFTAPTRDYLFSIGIVDENQKDYDKRISDLENKSEIV
jgi:hypothetical protein